MYILLINEIKDKPINNSSFSDHPNISRCISFVSFTSYVHICLVFQMKQIGILFENVDLTRLTKVNLFWQVNGQPTMQMAPDETLRFIKSSYEVNSFVKLLVVSEFCYQWLYENDLLATLHSKHPSVFSYSDYLKHNHRFVPRLCKIKLFPFSKSFGFSVETTALAATVTGSGSRQTKTTASSYAHLIMTVERDSPAFTSSLLKGDRIIECDGINVEHENKQQITERIYQAFVGRKQITLFVVDPDTDNFFKAKCIKLHSFLPIVQSITNSTDI